VAGVDEEYLEAVLDVVAAVPAGRATTYGTVADVVRDALGRGGPRQVGRVLALAGGGVPWWRVVNASGRPPVTHRARAIELLRAEGCPLRGDTATQDPTHARVDLATAVWWPDREDGEPGTVSAGRDAS
jgi:methylated-DNA-protein-cysteine methyltransferase related protein